MKVVKIARGEYGIKSIVYSQELRDIAKETPGVRWSPRERAWVGYPDAIMVVASRLEHEFDTPVDVRKLPQPGDYGEPPIPVAWKGLRDYQRTGVKFLVDQGPTGALLADGMGLGKSIQAITAARAFRMKTVIVCPSYSLGVWARRTESMLGAGELAKWWPKAAVAMPEGVTAATLLVRETKKLREAGVRGLPAMLTREGLHRSPTDAVDVVVVSCDVVHAWVDAILGWAGDHGLCLVVDEIHQFQSAKSRRYFAVRELSLRARVSIGLTGTPVTNYLQDLWTLVDILSPGRYGSSFFTYGVRHCVPPNAPIWMADGSFKPIGEVKPGEEVIGWRYGVKRNGRSGPGGTRTALGSSKVLGIGRRQSPLVKITLESGAVVRCSPDHRWLSGKHYSRKFPYVSAKVGRHLARVIHEPPTVPARLRRTAGWVGGLFDGEGTISNKGSIRISQSPKHNPEVCAKIGPALSALGFEWVRRHEKVGQKGVCDHWGILGGRQALSDFLNITKPARRVKAARGLWGAKFKALDRIVSIEPDGEGEVVSLTTDTGNYVVYGYASKNCEGHQVQVTPEKIVWKWDGASHLDELHARLEYNMLRRTKKDVRLELPPKERTVLDVEVPARARIVAQQDVFKNPRQLRRLLDQAANAKMPKTLERLVDHAQSGRRVVCFTHRRNIAEYLTAELLRKKVPATWIHGGLSRKARDRRVAEARGLIGPAGKKARGAADGHVLCATIDTMGVSVDLSYASVGVFAELSWEWAKLAQAEDRLHRHGQTLLTVIEYIIARGTTDEIVISAVLDRLRNSDEVVGKGDEGLAEDLDTAPKGREALDLLAERMMAQAKRMWETA